MGPLLGRFEFDLAARTAAFYSLAVLFVVFLVLRRVVHSPFGVIAAGAARQPAAR